MIQVFGNIDVSDVKRLYVELDTKFQCPQCGEKVGHNRDQYLSYVRVNDQINMAFYCESCDDYFLVPVLIKSFKIKLECYPEKAKMDK